MIQLRQAADGLTPGREIKLRTKTPPHHYDLKEKLVGVSFKRGWLGLQRFSADIWCILVSHRHPLTRGGPVT